jgi:site-specific DNA recombinase
MSFLLVSHSTSVSSQIDAGLAYAKLDDLTLPAAYQFREDFSGRTIDRPELSKIRQLVKEKKIQAVIIHSTDRLARRVSVGEILLDEFFDYGVQLHNVSWGSYVKSTPADRLRFNFETTFSGFERDKIVERTTRGKQKKASQGFIVGNNHPAYGLKLNSRKDNFELGEEAPIARQVLLMYGIQHVRTADIVRYLEEQGHESPGVIRYEQLKASFEENMHRGAYPRRTMRRKNASPSGNAVGADGALTASIAL